MRNTTMRDKLSAVLGGSIPVPMTGAKARRLVSAELATKHHKKRPYMADRRPVEFNIEARAEPETQALRYIIPPKKRKPFAVHVYPISPVQPEIQTLDEPLVEETPPVEVVKEPPKMEEEVSRQFVAAWHRAEPIAVVAPVPVSKPELAPETQVVVKEELNLNQQNAIESQIALEPQPLISSSSETEVISASVVPDEQAPTKPPQVAGSLPPNLNWLEKQTPFAPDLKGIVDRVRDAKTRIAFTMEQLRHREEEIKKQCEKARADLDSVQFQIEQQRDYTRQLDDMIAACAIVAKQSAAIDPGLFSRMVTKQMNKIHTVTTHTARWSGDPSFCHRKDVLALLKTSPNEEWNADKVRKGLPAIMQTHAHKVVPGILANLTNEGILQRVSVGFYCLAKTN
jgi:hypothetical protein